MDDDARYDVFVSVEELPAKPVLIALAELTGENALTVRKALSEGRFRVARGHYDEVRGVLETLAALGLAHDLVDGAP